MNQVFKKFSPKDIFSVLLERVEGGEREKHQLVASHVCPNHGLTLQPSSLWDSAPTHWATLVRNKSERFLRVSWSWELSYVFSKSNKQNLILRLKNVYFYKIPLALLTSLFFLTSVASKSHSTPTGKGIVGPWLSTLAQCLRFGVHIGLCVLGRVISTLQVSRVSWEKS